MWKFMQNANSKRGLNMQVSYIFGISRVKYHAMEACSFHGLCCDLWWELGWPSLSGHKSASCTERAGHHESASS
jgi:hypothetical protein